MHRPLPREPHPAKRPINGSSVPRDDMTLRSKGPVLDSLRTMFRGEVIVSSRDEDSTDIMAALSSPSNS